MSVEIIKKQNNQELFWQNWQKLVEQSKLGPRYLPATLKFFVSYSKDRGLLIKDESFIYLVNNQPAAGVFLLIERENGKNAGLATGGYLYAPIIIDSSKEKEIFNCIDQIAQENNLSKISFSIDPLDKDRVKYNFLQKYNYLDTSILSFLIDLKASNDLLASCRKGHKYDIKRMLRNPDFKVFYIDKNNPDYHVHEEYRQLHHKCAGRVTRPKETFDLQFEKLKNNQAVLVGLKYKDKNIAYSYFDYNFDKAVYFSAADDPDYDHLPLYHVIIYSAMEYLKKQGVRYIHLEQPSSPSLQMEYYPDQKQMSIALFKRGFTGDFVQYFRGVKYFKKQDFEKDANKFLNTYKESL